MASGLVREVYSAKYWPGDTLGDHLEFALKYDGTNLLILAKLFTKAPQDEVTAYVRSKPNGKYARRIWYLYELLTGKRLPIQDVTVGNYVDLLEPDQYYTAAGTPVPRQRVRDNLLGNANFCPTVRRTELLITFERSDLAERCRTIVEAYSVEVMKRALAYLYTKESKSSFEIEHIKPTANRTERFVSLLQLAEREDFFQKAALIDLQNRTVDERFGDKDYRTNQNYVGEAIAWQRERVHFVSPRPGDLASLMEGMMAAHARMSGAGAAVHPVVHAAVVGYGLVFMHPFEDGNGRIHRFIIHNVLARRGFAPRGVMFPVSAVMLKRMEAYDASLEAFSRPLMPLVEYSIDDAGRMTVENQTADFYRYIDLTPQAEALFEFIRETIDVELVEELRYLTNYDAAKRAVQQVVDMPDRLIDLFIRCCLQNHGTLSKRKREEHFAMLDDREVAAMESAVQQVYHPT
ncbi:MAG: filamentation induced by cAMP protein Fic [Phycisphaerales bacterium]|nr:filamentation induced by cAMP protein Fic [Phycisphaerales bacterium]